MIFSLSTIFPVISITYSFFNKLASLCTRYNPLVGTLFEVERIGKKGDTNTTYETYPLQSDNAIIEDFPEIKAEDITYQVKSYDDLIYFLQNGILMRIRQNLLLLPPHHHLHTPCMLLQMV